eukprot:GHVU01115424.1.p3 GENE.GHVU01115424.1~~GHVU01115424.1.p3  ORF type:complete len:146 (-),score=5.26 GHVU01115424.1:185-622(-)
MFAAQRVPEALRLLKRLEKMVGLLPVCFPRLVGVVSPSTYSKKRQRGGSPQRQSRGLPVCAVAAMRTYAYIHYYIYYSHAQAHKDMHTQMKTEIMLLYTHTRSTKALPPTSTCARSHARIRRHIVTHVYTREYFYYALAVGVRCD